MTLEIIRNRIKDNNIVCFVASVVLGTIIVIVALTNIRKDKNE